MTGARIARLVPFVVLAALVVWIASKTSWVEVHVPMPLRGEAARNPFYAAQRLAEALGARAEWDREFGTPNGDAAVVASYWNWDLTSARREQMKRWVESGGRLVVDRAFLTGGDDFEHWSGVGRTVADFGPNARAGEGEIAIPEAAARLGSPPCAAFKEGGDEAESNADSDRRYMICGFDRASVLTSAKKPRWFLRGEAGLEAVRVGIGRGSVTVINATPFLQRSLFDGDHARLLVAGAQLRSGDEIHFLSEDDHPSLLALTWRFGAPVVLLAALCTALALWRSGARFGPLMAPTDHARRSLAEQIRGTGQFVVRFGGGESLHAAAVRALHEAAVRRLSGYGGLASEQRVEMLAREAGLKPAKLASAFGFGSAERPKELASSIALLESVRRNILLGNTGSKRGTS